MKKYSGLIWLVLLITGATFAPALWNDYLNWDDTTHYLENPLLQRLDLNSLRHIFSHEINFTYIPLTELSFALELHLFGYNSLVSHLINIFLHLLMTWSVYRAAIALGTNMPVALGAALLFGIHPMRVESVAWVTGRKDLLYALFYIAAMLFYLKWVRSERRLYYSFSILCGLLSILAKPMALSLPLALILIDLYCQRKMSGKLLLEKVPYLICTAGVAYFTYIMNSRPLNFQYPDSALIWIWCLTFYLRKFFWPIDLNPIYALPRPVQLMNVDYVLALLTLGLVFYLWKKIKDQRLFNFALLFYFVSVFFLLRFDDKADVNIVADRFMYLASFGICIFIAHLAFKILDRLQDRSWLRNLCGSLMVIAILLLSLKTVQQTLFWRDSVSLWSAVLQRNPDSFLALTNRANAFLQRQDADAAIKDLERSLRINPTQALAFYDLGQAYHQKKDYPIAFLNYSKSIQLDPELAQNYVFRANILADLGQHQSAIEDFTRAIRFMPGDATLYNNRGNSLMKMNAIDAALNDYDLAIRSRPNYLLAYFNRANAFTSLGQYVRAIDDYNRCLKLDQSFYNAYINRGNTYRLMGRFDKALEDILKARRLGAEIKEEYINFLRAQETQK